MTLDVSIMMYYGDKRGKKWQTPPKLTDESKVACGAYDWAGQVKDAEKEASKEGTEYRCPKCGNYIFMTGQYTVRICDRTKPQKQRQ